MRAAIVVLGLLCCGTASAGNNLDNWLIGPVFGVQLNGKGTVIGVEGGGGYGPERFNLGFEHRSQGDITMGYIEVDPWFLVGGTLGIGVQNDGKTQPVLGAWEGFPVWQANHACDGWREVAVISGGYRYTGVHELYVSFKAGWIDGSFCFD